MSNLANPQGSGRVRAMRQTTPGFFLHFDKDASAAQELSPSLLPSLPVMLHSTPLPTPRSLSPRSVMSVNSQVFSRCTLLDGVVDGAGPQNAGSPEIPENCMADVDPHPFGCIEGTKIPSRNPLPSCKSNTPLREPYQSIITPPKRNRKPLPLPVLTQTQTDANGNHVESAALTDSVLHARSCERLEKALRPKCCSPRRDQPDATKVVQRSACVHVKLPCARDPKARQIDNVLGLPVKVPEEAQRTCNSFKRLHDTQTIASSIKDNFSITEHRKKYCMPSIKPKIPEVILWRGNSPSSRRVDSAKDH